MNIKKQELYRKAFAKVLYTISICINLLDRDLICEFATVKEKWNKLYEKYSKVRLQANQEDITKITAFKLLKDTKIEDVWISLKETRRRVVTANDNFKHMFTKEMLFKQLLFRLLNKYSIT